MLPLRAFTSIATASFDECVSAIMPRKKWPVNFGVGYWQDGDVETSTVNVMLTRTQSSRDKRVSQLAQR